MITRSDPLRDALSLRRAMDQLFEQSFVQPGLVPPRRKTKGKVPCSRTDRNNKRAEICRR